MFFFIYITMVTPSYQKQWISRFGILPLAILFLIICNFFSPSVGPLPRRLDGRQHIYTRNSTIVQMCAALVRGITGSQNIFKYYDKNLIWPPTNYTTHAYFHLFIFFFFLTGRSVLWDTPYVMIDIILLRQRQLRMLCSSFHLHPLGTTQTYFSKLTWSNWTRIVFYTDPVATLTGYRVLIPRCLIVANVYR